MKNIIHPLRYAAILLCLLLWSCDKDEWSPPQQLKVADAQAPITKINHPSDFATCYGFTTFHPDIEWGWLRVKINGETYRGVASVAEDANYPGRYRLLYFLMNYTACEGFYSGEIRDISLESADEFSHVAWTTEYAACSDSLLGYPPKLAQPREGRTHDISLLNYDIPVQQFVCDTTPGLATRVWIDDVDPNKGFVQGRFVAHFKADFNCPERSRYLDEVFIEEAYFEANILEF